MYTSEEKQKAMKLYEEVRSVTKVIQKLGYPTREDFYKWLKELKNPSEKVKAPRRRINNSTAHPLHPSPELKLETIRRLFERGENVKSVSEEIGYSRPTIYAWKQLYDKKEANSTSEEIAELNKYSLPELLKIMKIAESSYYYLKKSQVDKYRDLRIKIREIFEKNRCCYGYRRIHAILSREDGVRIKKSLGFLSTLEFRQKMGLVA